MTQLEGAAAGAPFDLTNCDREPIHIPGAVQPHGVLLALREPALEVTQVSDNAERLLGIPTDRLLGSDLSTLLDGGQIAALRERLRDEDLNENPLYVLTARLGSEGLPYNAVVHRRAGLLILELDPAASPHAVTFRDLYGMTRTGIARLQAAHSVLDLCEAAAGETRRLSGFDRVMIYRFDADWHGEVVAEATGEGMAPFLGLHFPASDIPAQARALYVSNRVRLIADVGYEPARLVPERNPLTGKPLDLSFAALRSVSPVHVEYLRNMGVAASMSVSIVKDGQLWGLIACHHPRPRQLPYDVRVALDLLGQALSTQLAAKAFAEDYEYRMRLKAIEGRLLQAMAASENFADGLAASPRELLAFAAATGAAIFSGGACRLVGQAPTEAEVRGLVAWLAASGEDEVFDTDSLPSLYEPGRAFKDRACGVLALSVSRVHRTYVLWFRPEIVRTVTWSGDPHKPATASGTQRLHPRKSFEAWKQDVTDRSARWHDWEVRAAAELRNAIVGVVLRRAEELNELAGRLQQSNRELERTNRELEAFSYSVSHDLRAPFRHIVGFADLLHKRASQTMDETSRRYLGTIVESARYAGNLVDSLLAFSQMGRSSMSAAQVDMNALFAAVRSQVEAAEAQGRAIEWRMGDLPDAEGDFEMLRLAVGNLLSNAIKYTRGREQAVVEVGSVPAAGDGGGQAVYFVRDNGAGFDMRYVGKLFGVFQRLHRAEEFEGTGIGLANVRRIVERHGGRAWAEGTPGGGATFYFSLPAPR